MQNRQAIGLRGTKGITIGIGALILSALPANALNLNVGIPIQQGAQYSFNVTATNDDIGAIYNSASTDLLADFYINGLTVNSSVSSPDLFSGWNLSTGVTTEYTNDGILADFTYTRWDNDSNSNDLTSNFTIHNSELDTKAGNNNGSYQAFTLADVTDAGWDPGQWDAIIVRTDNALLALDNYQGDTPYNNMATYTADLGGPTISDQAPGYAVLLPGDFTVVPEPRSYALITGLAALALLARRRSR